jgi:hypothetical protein
MTTNINKQSKGGQDLVPYFDMKTGTTIQIPKAELSPNVVWVQIKGEPGPVYVNVNDITLNSKKQHESLPSEAMNAIRQFKRELADVCPKSFNQWEDGFLKDLNPDREIAGWMRVSIILREMTNRHDYKAAQRKECFRILMACFNGERRTVRERSDTQLLPEDQVEEAIKSFYEGEHTKNSK